MTNVLLVAVDSTFEAKVTAISGHHVVSINRDNMAGALAQHAASSFRPDVILIGAGLSVDRALNYGSVVRSESSEIAVFLVADAGHDLARRAIDAGISGVVDGHISSPDLAILLERAGHTIRPSSAEGGPVPHQVIVIASPKGGVGKTTTAINLAALLAESAPGEVVLLDLDLQFGDVASMLDLTPTYTTVDAFASGVDDSMRLRTLLTPHPSHFFVLAGSDHPAGTGNVTGDQIRKLVSHYSMSFRYVIVDTPAGLHEETLASLEEATDVIFMATLDVATLRTVRREVEVLAELFLVPQRRHVVLNRTDRRSGLSERDAARIIGLPIDTAIPTAERVVLSANRGELAVSARRRNPVRAPFQQLAQRVADLSGHNGRDH